MLNFINLKRKHLNMKEIYRPEWTCGRYHKSGNNNYALVYNLIEGMAYFFEDESAILIKTILQFPRNGLVPIKALLDSFHEQFSENEIREFCNELIQVGILSEGLLNVQQTKEIRKKIGINRKTLSLETEKTVQERLPFLQDDAENTYMDLIEKDRIPFVVMLELTYNCNEKCVHCFNPGAARNDNEKSLRNKRQEIGLDTYEKLFDELCSKIENNRIVSNYDFDIMEYTVGPILFNGIYKEKYPLNEANNIKLLDKIIPNFREHKSTFFERLFYR